MRYLPRLAALAMALCLLMLADSATAQRPGRATAVELLASAARTADTTVNVVNTYQGYCSAYFIVDVTADPAAASVLLKIRMLELDGTTAWGTASLLVSAAIDAVGQTIHAIGATTAAGTLGAGFQTAEATQLPSHWQLFMDHADTDSITYSVTAYFFPQCL